MTLRFTNLLTAVRKPLACALMTVLGMTSAATLSVAQPTLQNLKTVQSDWCGTPMTQEDADWVADRIPQYRDVARKTNTITYIPMVFHLVANSAGVGRITEEKVFETLCDLNKHYLPSGIQFYIKPWSTTAPNRTGLFHEYNSTYYYNMPKKSDSYTLMNQFNDLSATNTYIMNSAGAGLCGFAYFPSGSIPGRGGLFMSNSSGCMGAGTTTATHEMGHYFGLPHTFGSSFSPIEYVDGTNCSGAGDFFCDTRADYIDTRWNCPYSFPGTLDPKGDVYYPDSSFYMSYSSDECQTQFSQEQMNSMNLTITNDRPYLLGAPVPAAITDTATILEPAQNNNWTPSNNVVLRWKNVPGAYAYKVEVRNQSNNFRFTSFFTNDTTRIVTNIPPQFNIYWTVSALGVATGCDTIAQSIGYFKTTWLLSTPEEALESKGAVALFPSVVSNGQSLRVATDLAKTEELDFQVVSLDGRILRAQQMTLTTGPSQTELSLPTLAAGQYLLRYSGAQTNGVLRFTVTE